MPCEPFLIGDMPGIICYSPWYRFEHEGKTYYFEWHRVFGPSAISKRTGDILVRTPSGFYEAASAWRALPEEEREACAWSPWGETA